MKKTLILLVVNCYVANSQCEKTASNFGNNTSNRAYNVSGKVDVILNTDNSFTVNLGSNFSTASGPDVKLFLVDRGTLTTTQLKNPNMFATRPKINFGQINATGMQTFTQPIPEDITISEIDTVYFLCESFNEFWDFGTISEFTTNNCTVLDNENFIEEKIALYPNPIENQLYLSNTDFNAYKIYNTIGALVQEDNNFKKDFIDFSNFNSGLYIIELNKNGTTLRKTIIKK
jgi:hypothetical protein